MIAADSSVVIDHFAGIATPQTAQFEGYLLGGVAVLAPATLTELLSDPRGGRNVGDILNDMKLLPLGDGYWERAGLLRAKVRQAGCKAALGDALIAQACIDADAPLLTSDTDFEAFAKLGGLKLA